MLISAGLVLDFCWISAPATGLGTWPCSIGPDGEGRTTFDDVDDYDGLSGAPSTATGSALTGYSGFAISIAVTCAGTEVGLPAEEAKRIDLDITAPGNQTFSFTAYRANF